MSFYLCASANYQPLTDTVVLDNFRSDVLKEVVRFLMYKTAHSEGVSVAEFEVDKDLAIDVLLAASYLQID